MKTSLLIDGDEFLFKACAAVEREIRWDEFNHVLYANREEAWANFVRMIGQLQERFKTKEHLMCFSGAQPYFRAALAADYKGGRPGRKPLCYADLRELCDSEYKTISFPHIEADDVMGIMATKPDRKRSYIIVSQDKDMMCIPGALSRDGREVMHITPAGADYFHMYQTLVGDPVDNFKGVPGIGPKKAEKLLNTCPTPEWWWGAVVAAYEKAKLTEADALTQARLARILRFSDWDHDNKQPILWTP